MSVENKGVKVGVRDIGEIISLFDRLSGRLNVFNILSKSLKINISQGTYDLELGIEVRSGRPFNRVIYLPIFNSIKVQLTSLPFLQNLDEAIIFDEVNGLVLSLDYIPKKVDNLMLNIKCPLSHRRFMDRLIYKKVQTEPRKNIMKYEMNAQFRHIDLIRKKIDSIRIDDLDFMVNVHMEQDIKNIIPHSFIQQMEVGNELLNTRDRERKRFLADEHLRLARVNNLVGQEEKVIKEIDKLLEPSSFENYLDVLGQFRYYNCYQGASFLRIPNFILPSRMNVITKTELTLIDPATKGELHFKKGIFEDDFNEIFPENKKKSRKR